MKAKLSDSSSAAGHYDARCRLIKCLEFMPASDIQGESETNSVIEFSLSLKTILPRHLISYLNTSGSSGSAAFFFYHVVSQSHTSSLCYLSATNSPAAAAGRMVGANRFCLLPPVCVLETNCRWKSELEFGEVTGRSAVTDVEEIGFVRLHIVSPQRVHTGCEEQSEQQVFR